jgi:hypothetical protein
LIISHLIGWLKWVHRAGSAEYISCHIIVVKGIKLSSFADIRALSLSSFYIFHREELSRLKVLLDSGLGSLDIVVLNLIADELRRRGSPILDLGQLVLRIQRIRRGPRRLEPLTLGLTECYVLVAEVVLGLVQLYRK